LSKNIHKLLSYFPEVVPPVTLTDESIDHISATNDAIPAELLSEFIVVWDGEEMDEFTEYVPCFKLPKHENYLALVYWKASLLKYEYILATIDKNAELINKNTICGTIVEGDIIKKSVASIDEEMVIHIVAGAQNTNDLYHPDHSQNFTMEIVDNGEIAFLD
jgi:hypothetical protein